MSDVLQEVIGHQHEDQKEQSDLTKWFTVTAGGTSHTALQLPAVKTVRCLVSVRYSGVDFGVRETSDRAPSGIERYPVCRGPVQQGRL